MFEPVAWTDFELSVTCQGPQHLEPAGGHGEAGLLDSLQGPKQGGAHLQSSSTTLGPWHRLARGKADNIRSL